MSTLEDAREALLGGDLANAQAIAADLLKTDPDNAGAWYVLSEAVEGDRKEIFQKKALALNPDIASEFMPELPSDEEIDELLSEDVAQDEVMSLNSSDFPSLRGPSDEDELETDMGASDSGGDDNLDDFYVAPAVYSDDDDTSTESGASDSTDSDEDETAEEKSGSGLDTNLLLLVTIAAMIVLVLYMLVQSL